MVDYLALAISHGLMLVAAFRLVMRDDLDRDPADVAREAERKGRSRRA